MKNIEEVCKTKFVTALKELREEKGLSQKQVAELLGLPISTYANWEQGRREPSITDIFRLLQVFDATANELFPQN
ncbi:MAG: helix-turn-helix transcriptional regulator [Clostridiales bacterium]|nr:helix-turn-helix transcriptional regulator [Clostridiales bacterium]